MLSADGEKGKPRQLLELQGPSGAPPLLPCDCQPQFPCFLTACPLSQPQFPLLEPKANQSQVQSQLMRRQQDNVARQRPLQHLHSPWREVGFRVPPTRWGKQAQRDHSSKGPVLALLTQKTLSPSLCWGNTGVATQPDRGQIPMNVSPHHYLQGASLPACQPGPMHHSLTEPTTTKNALEL